MLNFSQDFLNPIGGDTTSPLISELNSGAVALKPCHRSGYANDATAFIHGMAR